jgi:hypothetical protein
MVEGEENGSTARYESHIFSHSAITAESAKLQWYISQASNSESLRSHGCLNVTKKDVPQIRVFNKNFHNDFNTKLSKCY